VGYYRHHYTPDNAVLIVVGHVAAERVFEGAKTYFGDLEQGGRPSALDEPLLPIDGPPHQVTVRGPLPTDQVRLMLGARTVGRGHPDRWALEVLAEILDQGLLQEIRYQRGLVYGLSAFNRFFDDSGYFVYAREG
jgi:zinc protease